MGAQGDPNHCGRGSCQVRLPREVGTLAGLEMKDISSRPITSWQIDGETMETVMDFIFLDSKITADGDCNHEIKKFAPWKISYDKHSVLKSKDVTLPTKACIIKAVVFPVVMYGCESWTVQKAEH